MAPKKGKGKAKGQTVNLADFLQQQAPQNTVAATLQVRGWADEVDDDDSGRPVKQVFLPTAPRAAMEFNDDHVPYNPPYTAHIANLSYDTDEQQVKETFERARLRVETVRLMKDEGGRLKGYGYMDFEDRESLVNALQMSEITMSNRKVRIDLATGAGKSRDGGGGFDRGDRGSRWGDRGGERGGDRDPDAGRSDANDWRSAPPPPSRDRDDDRNRSRGGGGGFDRFDSDRGGDRFGGGFRDRGDDRGSRGGGGGFDNYRRRSPEPVKERPRIVLQKRTVEKEEEVKPIKENSGDDGAPRASIFGSAKPIDTTAREKEIEEKLGKMNVKEEEKPGVYRPPGARGEASRNDDRRDDRRDGDRFGGSSGGFGRRGDDRRDDRYNDRDRRDGYDRRDNYGDRRGGGGFDRRDDRRDDRGGYDRRDYDRRDDRDFRRDDDRRDFDRRDDRDVRRDDRDMRRDDRDFRGDDRDTRRDDRDSAPRDYQNGRDENRNSNNRDDGKSEKVHKPMKKFEEPKAPDVVGDNKFAFLQEDGSDSASDDEE